MYSTMRIYSIEIKFFGLLYKNKLSLLSSSHYRLIEILFDNMRFNILSSRVLFLPQKKRKSERDMKMWRSTRSFICLVLIKYKTAQTFHLIGGTNAKIKKKLYEMYEEMNWVGCEYVCAFSSYFRSYNFRDVFFVLHYYLLKLFTDSIERFEESIIYISTKCIFSFLNIK